MQDLVFVYGTLKEGFCNSATNGGTRLLGEFETVEHYPLYIIGLHYLPWLVNARGKGHKVIGQLFEIGIEALAQMDEFEEIDRPYWYTRAEIMVRKRGSIEPVAIRAQVYFGSAVRMEMEVVHHGPLAEYTHVHEADYSEQDIHKV